MNRVVSWPTVRCRRIGRSLGIASQFLRITCTPGLTRRAPYFLVRQPKRTAYNRACTHTTYHCLASKHVFLSRNPSARAQVARRVGFATDNAPPTPCSALLPLAPSQQQTGHGNKGAWQQKRRCNDDTNDDCTASTTDGQAWHRRGRRDCLCVHTCELRRQEKGRHSPDRCTQHATLRQHKTSAWTKNRCRRPTLSWPNNTPHPVPCTSIVAAAHFFPCL